MNSPSLVCPGCGAPLPATGLELESLRQCPRCQAGLEILVFPALFRTPGPVAVPQRIVAEGEAACFYHPEKRAVVACDGCGRFLCALCDLEMSRRHWCVGCLEKGSKAGAIAEVERGRVRYDQIVWTLLLLSLLVFCLMPVTALAALGLVIWKWRDPGSLVARSRVRMAAAIPVGLAELVFGTWLCLQLFNR